MQPADPSEINLDLDRDDVLEVGPPPRSGPPRRWLVPVVLVGALLAAGVAYGQAHGFRLPSAGAPPARYSANPSPTRVVPEPGGSVIVGSVIEDHPVLIKFGEPPLPAASGSWELFTLGADTVSRVQFSANQAYQTHLPPSTRSDRGGLVVFPEGAVIWSDDAGPGQLVPDGSAARPLQAGEGQLGPALPGPRPATFWVQESASRDDAPLVALDPAGRLTGDRLARPSGSSGAPISDRAGYAIVTAVGGVYDLRPDGPHRITTGALVAIGRTRYLVQECDASATCSLVLIDRPSGARRTVASNVVGRPAGIGEISPDGRTATVLGLDAQPAPSVRLMDLATGQVRQLNQPVAAASGAAAVWSPDSRWAFVIDEKYQVVAIERATSAVTPLPVLGPVTALAIRAATS